MGRWGGRDCMQSGARDMKRDLPGFLQFLRSKGVPFQQSGSSVVVPFKNENNEVWTAARNAGLDGIETANGVKFQ